MFYEVKIEDVIRIPPRELGENETEDIKNILISSYIGLVRKDIGIIVAIKDIEKVDLGVVIPEDGGVYYKVVFRAYVYKPEINEITYGIVSGITDFGAFINMGPIDGLVHISQIMDDEVSISGKDALIGKKTKKVLKVGDLVKARVITVSYKDITNIRVSLTMKQPRLGKIDWLEEKNKTK
ncbi:MAG: DNA-directed RNA polymerase [Nanopusillaceae archaeon]